MQRPPGAFFGARRSVAWARRTESFENILGDAVLAQAIDTPRKTFDLIVRSPNRSIHARKARTVFDRKTLRDATMHSRIIGLALECGSEC